MKKLILTAVMVLAFISTAMAADCWVNGYYRSNGTYVQGYYRSCPDSDRSNNYGRGKGSIRQRDYDNDGTPNWQDKDDDNDGIPDNNDRRQYGR